MSPSQPLTFRRLVNRAELSGIDCYEAFGARGAVLDDGSRTIIGPGAVDEAEFTVENNLGVYWGGDGGRFVVRLSAVLTSSVGDLRAGVQAEYLVEGVSKVDVLPVAEERFVNDVAVMMLVPFLREAVADVALRTMGRPVVLPLWRRGSTAFASPETVED